MIDFDQLIDETFTIDSRSVKPGNIFLAFRGHNVDGSDFITSAIDQGAYLAITERETSLDNVLQVPNVNKFVKDLAFYKRDHIKGKVICITGSVGKTTTKELIHKELSRHGQAYKTFKNFNNALGLELSILNTPLNSDFCIYELGINHSGEMEPLSKLARPDIAIITQISNTHIENFGSIIELADEKAKIMSGMSGGCAIFNEDDAFCEYFFKKSEAFGVKAHKYENEPLNKLFQILDLADKCPKHFTRLPGRGEIFNATSNGKHITVIDHSYNACLESMRYAMQDLCNTAGKRKKIAVLGDMFELGDRSEETHMQVLPILDKYQVDKVFLCGKNFQQVYKHLPHKMQGGFSENSEEILHLIPPELSDEAFVMVKGSHGMKMDKVVGFLLTYLKGETSYCTIFFIFSILNLMTVM